MLWVLTRYFGWSELASLFTQPQKDPECLTTLPNKHDCERSVLRAVTACSSLPSSVSLTG